VLFRTPAEAPFTVTVIVQDVFAATVAPDRLAEEEPAVAVAVPPHVLPKPFGVATTKPVGMGSLKATPVRATALAAGFVIVKVSEVVPLSGIVEPPNALLIVGGAAAFKVAAAVFPVPPLVELTLPVTLLKLPAAVAVTFTPTAQLVL